MFKIIDTIAKKRRSVKAQLSEEQIKSKLKELYDERAKGIAARYTRGNVSIQEGRFLTKEEIDRELHGR